MATTVTVTELGVPTISSAVAGTVASGGLNDGEWYIRACSCNKTAPYYNGILMSDPCAEYGPVTLSAGAGLNKIDITFASMPPGAVGFNVYLRNSTAGELSYDTQNCRYASSNMALSTQATSLACSVNSYRSKSPWDKFASDFQMPGGISRELGTLKVDFYDGTGATLQTIYDALVAAGYGDYVYFDGWMFVLSGGLSCNNSNKTIFTAAKQLIILFSQQFDLKSSHADSSITVGTLSEGRGKDGCVIRMVGYGFETMANSKCSFYGCLFGRLPVSIPGYVSYESGYIVNDAGGTFIDCKFEFASKVSTGDYTGSIFFNELFPTSSNRTQYDLIHYNLSGAYSSALRAVPQPYNNWTFWRLKSYSKSDGTGYHIWWQTANAGQYWTFINCWFNSTTGKPNIYFGDTDGIIYFKRPFNVEIATANDSYLSGVTVDLQDVSGSYVWPQGSLTTGANGRLSSDQNVNYWTKLEGQSVLTDNGPFTLTLSKSGYQTLVVPDLDLTPSTEFVDVSAFVWQGVMVESSLPAIMFEPGGRPYKTFGGQFVLPI